MATDKQQSKRGEGVEIPFLLGWLLFLVFDFEGGPIGVVVAGPCLFSITSSLHHRESSLHTCLSGHLVRGHSSSSISSLG